MHLSKINILGVSINTDSREKILEFISVYLANRNSLQPLTIVTPNPEQIVYAQKNEQFRKILNSADISLPDGVGLKLANSNLKIIKGREFMVELFKYANESKMPIYLFGSTEMINDVATYEIKQKYPNVKVYGSPGPQLSLEAIPINDHHKQLETDIVAHINKLKPDILFVAFGFPKQELWVQRWLGKLNVKVIMVVGGSLNYLAGVSKLPPKTLENLGLEWLWRLIHEPWRIRRQLKLIEFVGLVLLEKMSLKN